MAANIYRCASGGVFRNIPDNLIQEIKQHFTYKDSDTTYRIVLQGEEAIMRHCMTNPLLSQLIDNA